LKICEI